MGDTVALKICLCPLCLFGREVSPTVSIEAECGRLLHWETQLPPETVGLWPLWPIEDSQVLYDGIEYRCRRRPMEWFVFVPTLRTHQTCRTPRLPAAVTVIDAFAGPFEKPREEPLEDTVTVREEVRDTSKQEEKGQYREKVTQNAEDERTRRCHSVEANGERYSTA